MKLQDPVARIVKQKGSEVYSVSPDATVYQALEQLAEKDIGALIVIDGSELVGIMSERDYVRKVILKGFSSRDLKVRDIMSAPVFIVTPQTTVDQCMQCMTANRCRHLPVVEDGGKLRGVVSIGDLVNWIISVQDFTIHQLEDYICSKYPA